jgi:hypothetical protein
VVSALLANIYLHCALDLSAVRWRRCEATGDMIIVRYADDFIVGFQHETDARRLLDEMRERLRKFALSLHPEKTRLIEFGRFAAERRARRGLGKHSARSHASEAQDDQSEGGLALLGRSIRLARPAYFSCLGGPTKRTRRGSQHPE